LIARRGGGDDELYKGAMKCGVGGEEEGEDGEEGW